MHIWRYAHLWSHSSVGLDKRAQLCMPCSQDADQSPDPATSPAHLPPLLGLQLPWPPICLLPTWFHVCKNATWTEPPCVWRLASVIECDNIRVVACADGSLLPFAAERHPAAPPPVRGPRLGGLSLAACRAALPSRGKAHLLECHLLQMLTITSVFAEETGL